MKRLIAVMGLCLLLAGCTDAVEISERDMVVITGVDKGYTDMFKATVGSAVLTGENGGKGKLNVRSAEGESLPFALELNDRADALSPYYGQLKTVLLGEGVLNDEKMLESAVEVLLKNNDINMRTIILGCEGDAEAVVKAAAKKENEYGLYIWDYYKNLGEACGETFKMTVNDIAVKKGGGYILPKIKAEEDGIKIGGGFVLDGFKLKGAIDGGEMLGAMLIKEDIKGTVIAYGKEAAKIKSNKRNIRLYDTDKNGNCRIDIFIKVQPLTEAFDTEKAQKMLKSNTEAALLRIYDEYGTDALGLFREKTEKAEFEVDVFIAVE